MSGSDGSSFGRLPGTPTMIPAAFVMPRPGQPGALQFDGTNVTEFLENWELMYEDYGLTPEHMCARLPGYCTLTVKDVVKLLPGYSPTKWDTLKAELTKVYWQHDKPCNTMTELYELMKISSEIDLNVYVLKYAAITDVLVHKSAMSQLDRVSRLLDGLPEELQKKALGFYTKKKWSLLPQDTTGTENPVFDELKDYVIQEVQTEQKHIVYNRERAVRDGLIGSPAILTVESGGLSAIATLSVKSVPVAASTTPATPDPIVELTKQLSQLTLFLQGQGRSSGQTSTIPTAASSVPRFQGNRIPRCPYCDSPEHERRGCLSLTEDLKLGLIKLNERGRVANAITGEEIPLMYGKGGIKRIVDMIRPNIVPPNVVPPTPASTPTNANTRAITFDDSTFGRLGDNSICVTTLDYERGLRIDEVVDVDVEEKRRREDLDRTRRVRSRLDNSVIPENHEQPMAPEIDVQHGPPPNSISEDSQATMRHRPKYRLGSELNQTVNASNISEKIMNVSVQLTIRDILAVSSDVSNYLHEQTRKKRIPLEATAAEPQSETAMASTTSAKVNQTTMQPKTYYALLSGQAKVVLDDEISVVGTLDDGSELNIMLERIQKRLNHPIDTNIDWRINGFDSKKAGEEIEELDSKNCVLGVLHDVLMDIGGVVVKSHVFVVKHCNADLILGRTWASSARAQFTNEDDGSYTVSIKSPDGRREVRFTAVPSDHERNREFVWESSLKA